MAQVLPPFAEKVPFISSNDVLEKCVAFVAEQGGARPAFHSTPKNPFLGRRCASKGPEVVESLGYFRGSRSYR